MCLVPFLYIHMYIFMTNIHFTFCYMFVTENSGNGEHSFETIMEINVVDSYIYSCFILYA